jgi:hypothetical protein
MSVTYLRRMHVQIDKMRDFFWLIRVPDKLSAASTLLAPGGGADDLVSALTAAIKSKIAGQLITLTIDGSSSAFNGGMKVS